MGKQPYIPLYIGDWEQDTNCLSLEAEGAWLKVVFKCWKNAGVFVTSRDSLIRLFKVDPQKFASILLEWKENNICDLQESDGGSVKIISRRLVREAEISRIRAIVGKKGGSKTQANTQAKVEQIPEYEYDIDNDIKPLIIEKEIEEKLTEALHEIYIDQERSKWKHVDFEFELEAFRNKVRGSPDHYRNHETSGIRLAFQSQLRHAKKKPNEHSKPNQSKSGPTPPKTFGGANYSGGLRGGNTNT